MSLFTWISLLNNLKLVSNYKQYIYFNRYKTTSINDKKYNNELEKVKKKSHLLNEVCVQMINEKLRSFLFKKKDKKRWKYN